jgi:hypothetical protein
VWHTHILDTAKYAADSEQVFGFFLHHFPYFGLRGPDDETAMRAAYDRTRDLFRACFGAGPDGAAGDCTDGGLCVPEGEKCDKRSSVAAEDRPRPVPGARDGARSCAGNCDADNGSCSPPSRAALARPRPGRSAAAA